MLPILSMPPIEIYGSLKIEPFWILVVIAAFVGCELAHRWAKRTGLNTKIMVDGLLWIMTTSFVTAHWAALLFSNPVLALKNPLSLLKAWDGLSSLGGFFGGTLGALVYFRRKKFPFLEYTKRHETLRKVTRWALTPVVFTIKNPIIIGMVIGIGGLIAIRKRIT